MPLTREDIARLIPHGESMSLLDAVVEWDADRIVCATASHRRSDNPLLDDGVLPSVCLIEYGAQAAAIHSVLVQHGEAIDRPAYLGALKNAAWHSDFVNNTIDELRIEARCAMQQSSGAVYDFFAGFETQALASGRIVLVQPG